MKREEKNAAARKKIIEAAMQEFSSMGYEKASLNHVCQTEHLSKGIIYHYFKDKDDIYLQCIKTCFDNTADFLAAQAPLLRGDMEEKIKQYFGLRLHYFAKHPEYLGIFTDRFPTHLNVQIKTCRQRFDEVNLAFLTSLLDQQRLREGLNSQDIAEEFRAYMDYFNLRFYQSLKEGWTIGEAIQKHEERCHQQISILLYGVIGRENEKR